MASKRNSTTELIYKTEADSQTERMNLWLLGGRIVREFRVDIHKLLYLKWVTSKDLLCSTGNPAECYVAVWVEGESGGDWIHLSV